MTKLSSRDSRPAKTTQRLSEWVNRHRALVLAGPAVAFIAAMVVVPVVYTVVLSLTDAAGSVRTGFDFIGLRNFVEVLSDTDRFWPAVARTAIFTISAVLLELVGGMAIALLLRRPFRGQGFVRTSVLLPLIATPVAVGFMWLLIFEPTIGAANYLLSLAGLPAQGWISSPEQALPTLIFVDVWQWTPMVALILLAGLSTLPEDPDEAARIDGASAAQRFWYVTIPLLKPTIAAALLLRGIDALKTFDILYATKGRGGGSFHEAETLNIYAYGLSFDYNYYGVASAVLVLFTAMIVLLATGLLRSQVPSRKVAR